jgi:hypothetical protein
MSKALVFGLCALALSAGTASAQYGYGHGYDNGYGYDHGYAAPVADLAPPAYGYGAGYGYAAPGYGYAAAPIVAPPQAGTTVIIVTPGAPAYTAPTVIPRPLYSYAPGYWGGFGGYGRGGYGRWRAGYGW